MKSKYEEDEIVEEERSSFQSRVHTVEIYSERESSETLKLFRDDVELVLREFMGHGSKRKDGSYVHGSTMLIYRLNA